MSSTSARNRSSVVIVCSVRRGSPARATRRSSASSVKPPRTTLPIPDVCSGRAWPTREGIWYGLSESLRIR